MKIKYIGKKPLLTVAWPIGVKGKGIKGKEINFNPGTVVELTDADGQKLIDLNKSHQCFVEAGAYDAKLAKATADAAAAQEAAKEAEEKKIAEHKKAQAPKVAGKK